MRPRIVLSLAHTPPGGRRQRSQVRETRAKVMISFLPNVLDICGRISAGSGRRGEIEEEEAHVCTLYLSPP